MSANRNRYQLECLESRLLLANFVVTGTHDSGAGSLRQAILDANNAAGPDDITFSIPGVGPHMINVGDLPWITGPTSIDGYSQPGSSANSLEIGNNANIRVELRGAGNSMAGLVLGTGATGSRIRGLCITGLSGNALAAIESYASEVRIDGNWIGLTPLGDPVGNNYGVWLRRSSINATIGGKTPAERNVVSGNLVGVFAEGVKASILGNYIGTTPGGGVPLPNETGVRLGGRSNQLGFPGALRRNVISGNSLHGVHVLGLRNKVAGNLIGPGVNGEHIGNGSAGVLQTAGVLVDDLGLDAVIGVDQGNPRGGNIIAYNNGTGVLVFGTATIRMNSIHDNTRPGDQRQLGIDLVGGAEDVFGVTDIDPLDIDFGPNDLNNFPILKPAFTLPQATLIVGDLYSTPNTRFIIDFYENAAPDPSGFGEGATHIGFVVVTTDGTGHAPINAGFPACGLPFISATSTDATTRRTSEFSPMVANETPPAEYVTNTNPSGPGSYHAAVQAAALTPGPDTILANLPAGPQTAITLGAPFLPVLQDVIIDLSDWTGHTMPRLFFAGTASGYSRHELAGNVTLRGFGLISGAAQQLDFSGEDNVATQMWINVSPSDVPLGPGPFTSGAPVRFLDSNNQLLDSVVHAGRGNSIVSTFNSDNIKIKGNLLGVGAGDTVLGGTAATNNGYGVQINGGNNIQIKYNTIAGVMQDAVEVVSGSGVRVYANTMYDNVQLGIDLGADGATPNDPLDADGGANGLQNYPVPTSAEKVAGGTRIFGNFNSTANTLFRIDAYASPADPIFGTNEGRRWLGSTTATTDASGVVGLDFVLPKVAEFQELVMLTATDPDGSTSEFSSGVAVGDSLAPSVQGSGFQFETGHVVRVIFNEDVSAGLQANDLYVQAATGPQIFPNMAYQDPETFETFFLFEQPLLDGNYLATLTAANISDLAGNTLQSNISIPFFVLSGDANRDRKIDAADLGILSANWQGTNKTFSQGDFNYDGKVDINDLYILATKWQQTLAPPPPAVPISLTGRTPTRSANRLVSSLF